jgi:hypothetical protein
VDGIEASKIKLEPVIAACTQAFSEPVGNVSC